MPRRATGEHDPYVGPPAEPRVPGRLDRARPALATAVVALLLGAVLAIGLIGDREDPSLEVPVDVPVVPTAPGVPGS